MLDGETSTGSTSTTNPPIPAPGHLFQFGNNVEHCNGRVGLVDTLFLRPGLCLFYPLCKELKESATELLFGGHETTASAATSLIAFLGLHHEVLQKVRKELQVKVCMSSPEAFHNRGLWEEGTSRTGIPDRAPFDPGGALF